jgi:hypothetical protein
MENKKLRWTLMFSLIPNLRASLIIFHPLRIAPKKMLL